MHPISGRLVKKNAHTACGDWVDLEALLWCYGRTSIAKPMTLVSIFNTSFEDDDLTVEELGKLIVARAAAYEDTGRESRRRKGSVESDASQNLQPTPSLKVKRCSSMKDTIIPGTIVTKGKEQTS